MKVGRAGVLGVTLALALVLAGCAATPHTPAGVRSWIQQSGFRASAALLRTDVAEIGRGIAAARLKETTTACDGLGADAASAIGELPAPDHQLTLELNSAYSDLVNGAQACSTASSFAAPGFARYRRDAAAGLAGLARAERRLDGLLKR